MTIERHISISASETPTLSITAAPISVRTVTVIAMTSVTVRIPRTIHRFLPPRPWNTYRKQSRVGVRLVETRGPPELFAVYADAPLPQGVTHGY